MTPAPAFRPALAPDPFKSLMLDAGRPYGEPLGRQRANRAAILATARRLLAEEPAQFTMRRLADECGTTTQTLRNGFGRREELLVAAFNDHTSAVWRALESFSSGPCMFLELAHLYHHCALARPAFLRAMVTAAIAGIGPLSKAQRHGSGIKSAHLRRMIRAGAIRPGVDPGAFAAHVTRLNTFMMYEWAIGGVASDLRGAMIDGNRRLLLGAVSSEEAALVEAWQPLVH